MGGGGTTSPSAAFHSSQSSSRLPNLQSSNCARAQPLTYIAGPERVHGQQVVAVSELELDDLLRGLGNKAQLKSPATGCRQSYFLFTLHDLYAQYPTDTIRGANDRGTRRCHSRVLVEKATGTRTYLQLCGPPSLPVGDLDHILHEQKQKTREYLVDTAHGKRSFIADEICKRSSTGGRVRERDGRECSLSLKGKRTWEGGGGNESTVELIFTVMAEAEPRSGGLSEHLAACKLVCTLAPKQLTFSSRQYFPILWTGLIR